MLRLLFALCPVWSLGISAPRPVLASGPCGYLNEANDAGNPICAYTRYEDLTARVMPAYSAILDAYDPTTQAVTLAVNEHNSMLSRIAAIEPKIGEAVESANTETNEALAAAESLAQAANVSFAELYRYATVLMAVAPDNGEEYRKVIAGLGENLLKWFEEGIAEIQAAEDAELEEINQRWKTGTEILKDHDKALIANSTAKTEMVKNFRDSVLDNVKARSEFLLGIAGTIKELIPVVKQNVKDAAEFVSRTATEELAVSDMKIRQAAEGAVRGLNQAEADAQISFNETSGKFQVRLLNEVEQLKKLAESVRVAQADWITNLQVAQAIFSGNLTVANQSIFTDTGAIGQVLVQLVQDWSAEMEKAKSSMPRLDIFENDLMATVKNFQAASDSTIYTISRETQDAVEEKAAETRAKLTNTATTNPNVLRNAANSVAAEIKSDALAAIQKINTTQADFISSAKEFLSNDLSNKTAESVDGLFAQASNSLDEFSNVVGSLKSIVDGKKIEANRSGITAVTLANDTDNSSINSLASAPIAGIKRSISEISSVQATAAQEALADLQKSGDAVIKEANEQRLKLKSRMKDGQAMAVNLLNGIQTESTQLSALENQAQRVTSRDQYEAAALAVADADDRLIKRYDETVAKIHSVINSIAASELAGAEQSIDRAVNNAKVGLIADLEPMGEESRNSQGIVQDANAVKEVIAQGEAVSDGQTAQGVVSNSTDTELNPSQERSSEAEATPSSSFLAYPESLTIESAEISRSASSASEKFYSSISQILKDADKGIESVNHSIPFKITAALSALEDENMKSEGAFRTAIEGEAADRVVAEASRIAEHGAITQADEDQLLRNSQEIWEKQNHREFLQIPDQKVVKDWMAGLDARLLKAIEPLTEDQLKTRLIEPVLNLEISAKDQLHASLETVEKQIMLDAQKQFHEVKAAADAKFGSNSDFANGETTKVSDSEPSFMEVSNPEKPRVPGVPGLSAETASALAATATTATATPGPNLPPAVPSVPGLTAETAQALAAMDSAALTDRSVAPSVPAVAGVSSDNAAALAAMQTTTAQSHNPLPTVPAVAEVSLDTAAAIAASTGSPVSFLASDSTLQSTISLAVRKSNALVGAFEVAKDRLRKQAIELAKEEYQGDQSRIQGTEKVRRLIKGVANLADEISSENRIRRKLEDLKSSLQAEKDRENSAISKFKDIVMGIKVTE